MKKRMLSILLALVMCVSMLPMQVFAAQDDSVTVTLDPETVVFSPAETSAQAMSLLTLDDAGKVALKATNEVDWIDRLDLTGAIDTTAFEEFDNNYALGFYHYLESSTHEGGDLRSAWASEYSAVTFTGKGEFAYTGDKAVDSEAAYAAIADELAANRNEASAYLSAVYYAFDRDHPEVFWLSGESMLRWYEGYSYSSDGTVTYEQTISFVLRDEEKGFDIRDGRYLDESLNLDEEWINDIDAESQAIATELSMVVRNIAQVDSREPALRELHDYLTTSNEYNTSDDLSSADSICWEYVTAIVGSEGTKGPVCEAYARAFKVVCDKAGIPCVLVDGFASPDGVDGEAHMWNYVQMEDGLWYAVDVTWDDPVVAGVSGAKSGYEHEDYFLVGAQTEIDGVTFEVSHPVSNAPSSSAPNFTNGPVLSDDDYVASEGGNTGDTGDSEEPRLMFYHVGMNDEIGAWVDMGWGMQDAWYSDGIYQCAQVVFCFGTEDDYIELDMDDLWVSDEKAVELIYEGTNTAGSDVMTLNVYEFGNHTVYYEDDTGVVHKMPVYVYLPDVGYFSQPAISEETYLHQFVLTETNRTYYLVSGLGDIVSVELSEDDADLAEYLQIEWEGNYASITFTENPPYTWMYPYLYVTIDRGEDYPDGWWAGMGLEVLVNESGEGGGAVEPEEPENPRDGGMCGDDLYWLLENGVLTISGSGAMYGYSGGGTPWANYKMNIAKVIVEDGVTSIGDYAFYECSALTEVVIPESVGFIGECAFAFCYALKGIDLPSALTSIEYCTFNFCEALSEITIPTGVTLVDAFAFNQCTALQEITFLGNAPMFCEPSMEGNPIFSGVTATVYYPSGNTTWTEAVMQNYGGTLTWVAVGGEEPTLTQIPAPTDLAWGRYYYWGNDGFTYAEYPGMISWRSGTFDYRHDIEIKVYRVSDDGTEDIEVWRSTWYCGRSDLEYNNDHDFSLAMLEELESGTYYFTAQAIGDGETTMDSELVTSDTWIYTRPTERLSAPTGLVWDGFVATWDRVSHENVGGYAVDFYYSPDESGENPECVTGFVRYSCEGEMLFFDPTFMAMADMGTGYYWFSVQTVSADMNTILHSECSDLSEPVYFEFDFDLDENGVLTVRGNGAVAGYWAYDPAITKVVIEEGITSIFTETFCCCENLTEVVIPGSVTEIDAYAFAWCEALENITFTGDAPYIGDYAFANVTATMYYPADNTTWTEAVMQNYGGTLTWVPVGEVMPEIIASGECGDNLTWELTDDGVLTIGGTGAMYDYDARQDTTLPGWHEYAGSITTVCLSKEQTTIGENAFIDLTALTAITVPDSVESIGYQAFWGCESLKDISFGNGLKSIGEYVFLYCNALETVTFGMALESIGMYAFAWCESLAEVSIPDNVTSLGMGAFCGCPALTKVQLGSGVKTLDHFMFQDCSLLSEVVGLEHVTTINNYVFAGTALTEITIPSSVQTIGNWTFQSCESLTKVVFEGDAPSIGDYAFQNVTATCYYPADNTTWTEAVMENYGGTLTWKPVGGETETGCLLIFNFPADLCDVYATVANTTEPVYRSGDRVEAGTYLAYTITDIADGYRIKSVVMNGVDRTQGFVNGAYGGMATTIKDNVTVDVELEPIPEVLPSVDSVTLYMDPAFAELAADNVTVDGNTRFYGKATYSDGVDYPIYYIGGVWEYSTDGINWKQDLAWGSNRFDYWPGWTSRENFDPAAGDFFVTGSYDLRLRVEPKDLYSTGAEVLSNVIHVNGGAAGGEEPEVPNELAVTDLHFEYLSANSMPFLYWMAPANVEGDLRYNVYASTDGGQSWTVVSSTSQELISLNGLGAAVYTMFKVETELDNKVVAECTAKLTLTVIQGENLPAATVVFTAPKAEGGDYAILVSGLTPYAWIRFNLKGAGGSSSSGSTSNASGEYTDSESWDNMSEYLADETSAYLVQEFSNPSIAEDGLSASFTVQNRGDWASIADAVVGGGDIGETDENRLMFRDLYWNEGVLVESEWLFTGWNPSVLDNMRVRFYFGTEDSYVAVDPGRLSVSGKGIYLECEYTEDGAVDYVWIHTIAFGDYQVIYTHTDGKEYSIPVTVGLPEVGFYSQPVASEENYLWEQFTVTEGNNTFYFVPRDGKLTRVELDERFAGIATAEIAEGGYAVITVTAVPDGDWYHLNYDFEDAYGNSYTNWGRGLNIKSGIPHLMYRDFDRDENGEMVERDQFRTDWNTAINSGLYARFYFGTEKDFVAVDPDSLSVSGKGITLEWVYTEDGAVDYVWVRTVAFGQYEVIYTHTDGKEYSIPVNVGLPPLGFYSQLAASEKTYIEEFTVSGENNTFYLIPQNFKLISVTLNESFAKIATVEIAEDGSYATVTVTGTPGGYWYYLDAVVEEADGSHWDWGAGLQLIDGNPHLMFRSMYWDENGVLVEDTEGFGNRWNGSIGSGLYARLYFGTEDSYVAVTPENLSVSGDGIYLEWVYAADGAVDYVWIRTADFGDYEIIYTAADGTKYTLPVTVGLPSVGLYSESVANEKSYLYEKFTVTAENNTFYVVPINGALTNVKLVENLANIATVTMGENGSYAAITVTGTPSGRWYNLLVQFVDSYGINRSRSLGLNLCDGNPHLMFRGMDWGENGWFEDPNRTMSSSLEIPLTTANIGKFNFGTEENCVPVDPDSLTVSGDGIELQWVYNNDGSVYYALVFGRAFGQHEIIYTDADGKQYTLPVTVSLPPLGFYTEPVASEDTYLDEFTVTDGDNTFYLIARDGMLTRVELDPDFAEIATVEISEDGSYAAITVTGTPNGNWYGLTADFGNEYWSDTGVSAGLRLVNGKTEEPETDYAVTDLRFEEKNGMPYLYWTAPAGLDQDVRYVVMLSMSVGGVNQWLHLNSTDETSMDLTDAPSGSYTAVKVVTKSGNTALGETLAESVADLALTVAKGADLEAASVVITPPETEGEEYTISISGMTPDTFFSFAMRNTDGIRTVDLLSDGNGVCVYYESYEQMQAYLNDADSTYRVREFSGSVSEDGKSADLTVSIRGGWFSIADAVVGGGSEGALMFREADWTPETGWFDNPDMVMSTEWNCQIKSAIIGKFFFVTDTESVELTVDQLTVSGNGVMLNESFGLIGMSSNNDGSYKVMYTHTDGVTYNFYVNVTLPNVAFYTRPVADGDYYVNVFTVTEMGQMLCLVPANGYKLLEVAPSSELVAIAQFEFNVGENYAIMSITGVPGDCWYDVEVTYGNDDELYTETVSVRLLNGMIQEDTQAPFVDLAAPDSVYGGSKYTPPLTIAASDNEGLEKVVLTYTVDGVTCHIEELPLEGLKAATTYDWNVKDLLSGLYTVTAVAYDAAGNESEPAAITITIDNDPPAVTENVTAEGDFEKIVLNWTADTTGDVSLYRIERDGVEISVVSAGVSSYTDYTAQPGAEHSYCVVAEDELGNRAASAVVNAQRTADEQDPVILDIWPTTEDNVTFCYDGTVALKLSDNWKLAKLEAFCGDELVYAAKMDYADGYVEFTWDVSRLNGEQTLDIKVTDAAGNVTERSVTVTVRPYSAPMIPGNLTAAAGFKTASLKWTYSGDLKTLKQFKVYSCDADGANLVLVNNVKNYKYTVRNLAQGTHYFVVAAEDIYGNLSGFARVEVYLVNEDNEAPVAVILPKDPMGVEGIAIDFSGVNSTDNDEIASYSWNFGDGITGTGVNCSNAYSQPGSYTVTLTVTDRSGNKTVAEKEVSVLDVTGADATHSIVTVTVMDGYVEGTPAIANATVTIYDEAGFEITALTDANGKAELVVPNGVCNVAAAASGYTASGRKIVVQGNETGRVDCTVYLAGSSVKTVDGSLTTHVMTYEEIVAAGIDTTDPANNHVVKHAFVLEFKPTPELAFEIPVVNYTNRNGDRVGIENQIIWYEFEVEDDDEDPGDGASPDWEHSVPMKVGVFPITEHFYLVIYGETHWLKEMFNVELLVINNSYAENITDCIAELELPEGLSLASMLVGGQSPVVSLGDIGHVGNTDGLPNQVSTNWYVRGDKEGEYTLTANVTGNFTQDLYNKTPFSTSFTTPAPIQVYAGSALKLFITAQDTAYYNTEYYVQFKLQNVSDRTLYNVSFGLTGAEQYRAEIQHRGKEGDVIKELDKLSEEHFGDAFYTVEEFRPGDAITVNFCTKTLFLSEEWEAFADKLEFINIAYKLQNVFVMTLEGSTTEIPYEVEILPVAKQSFAEWLWDQAKENVGDAIKDGAVDLIDAAFFGGIPVTENVVKVFEYAMDEYEKATNTADSYMTITLERGAYFDDGSSTWSGRSAQEGVRVYTDGKYEVAEDGSIRLYGNGKLYVERTGATVDENDNEIEPQINVTTHYVDGLGVTQEYTYSLVEEDGKSFVPDEDGLRPVVQEVYMEPPVGPGVTYKEENGEPVISVEKPSSDELEVVVTFPFVLLSKTGDLVVDGSNVLWQLIDALGNLNPEGMYLDQNGNLTIDANAKPGDYTVTLSLIQPLEGQRIIPGGAMLMSTGDEDEPVTSVSYTFTLEPAPVVADLTAMEVSFDAEILMWTYFIIPDELLNDDGAKVLVTKNGAWGKTTTEITMAELRAAGPTAYGDYRIEQGIASGEMTREVTVQIMDGDGNYVSIRDYVSGNVDTKVVRTAADYAARVFEVGSAKQKELVKAMLTYGGYSQKHFNVDAGNPVYNLLPEYGYEIPTLEDITAADIAQEMTKSAVSNGVTYSAQEAYLDSAIYHRVYFKLAAGEEISNFRFEIELIDVYGNLYTETVTATYDRVYDEYYVDIEDIAAAHLDHLYTVTVTNLSTGDTYEVTTSVLVWAKTVIARSYNVNQVNLAKAVYYYNQAANVFFGK